MMPANTRIRLIAALAALALWFGAANPAAAANCQISSLGESGLLTPDCAGALPPTPPPTSPSPPPNQPAPPAAAPKLVLRLQTPGDPASPTPIKQFEIDSTTIDRHLPVPATTIYATKLETNFQTLKAELEIFLEQMVNARDILHDANVNIQANPLIFTLTFDKGYITTKLSGIHVSVKVKVLSIGIPGLCLFPKATINADLSIHGKYDYLTGVISDTAADLHNLDLDASCFPLLSLPNILINALAEAIGEPIARNKIEKLLKKTLAMEHIDTAFGLNDLRDKILPQIPNSEVRNQVLAAARQLSSIVARGSGLELEAKFHSNYSAPGSHLLVLEARQAMVKGTLDVLRFASLLTVEDTRGAVLFDVYLRHSEGDPWFFWKTVVDPSDIRGLGWFAKGGGVAIVSYNRLIPGLRSRPAAFLSSASVPGGAK